MSDFKFCADFPVGATALAQFKLVKTPAALVVGAASTDDCIGIVQNGAAADAANVSVCVAGVTYALAHDGAIAKGDFLEAAAAGRVDTHSGTSTKPIIGIALEASGAQDDEIRILLYPQGMGPAA